MSYHSQHMDHPLSKGLIRGNVQTVLMAEMFELSDEELRKVDLMHTGNTMYADFQFLYFYIKHDCVITRAAKDLNDSCPSNFKRRLSSINVAEFAKVLRAYRKYRCKISINKPIGRTCPNARDIVKRAIGEISPKARLFTIKRIQEHIGNLNRKVVENHMRKLCKEGYLEPSIYKSRQGGILYKRTILGFVTDLEDKGVKLTINGSNVMYDAPKGSMTKSILAYAKRNKAKIITILHARR